MKREPLLIWSAILVGLQVLFAGAALADVIGTTWPALGALGIAAAQAGTTFYVRGQVTPVTTPPPAQAWSRYDVDPTNPTRRSLFDEPPSERGTASPWPLFWAAFGAAFGVVITLTLIR